jgi:hypothetical protein
MRLLHSFLLVALAGAVSACDRVPTFTRVDAVDKRVEIAGLEARFAEVARQVPGFGGYFYAADGVLTAYVADPATGPAARAVLASVADERRPSLHERRDGRLRILQGRYSFPQLAEWRDRLVPLLLMPGVVFVDADEAMNRVRIGLVEDGSRVRVRDAAFRLGVPPAALVISAERSLRPLTRLADAAGPLVPGGYRLSFARTASTDVQCSMGFNVADGGYVTASHCTRVQGRLEGTAHRQPAAPGLLGTEVSDPPMFTGGGCPAGRRCRYSDAARFRYAPGQAAEPLVARTAGVDSLAVDGTMWVAGELPYPVAGEVLDKVGAETGWTSGAVAATCVHVNVDGTDVTLLCQDVVDARAEGGDSGAPVFAWRGGEVDVAGVLWGGTGARFYFSAMANVEAELGALATGSPR